MLRLIASSSRTGEAVVALHGEICDESLPLLSGEVARPREHGQRLVLELADVRSITPSGLEALRRWVAEGMQLRGGSVFIRALLTAHGIRHCSPATASVTPPTRPPNG